jgi:hypothetical protein
MKLYAANAMGLSPMKNWRLYMRDHETGKAVKVATMADMPSPELEHSTAETIAAAVTACHGLELPSDIPAGAVAALLTAARDAEKMLSGIFREIDLPGEWENGTSGAIDAIRVALVPFKPLRKLYRTNPPIGKASFSLSFHDGVKKHGDGSPFWDIRIFKSQRAFDDDVVRLQAEGYIKD